MKSRASLDHHPLHPILVTFPVALWSTSLAYDLLGAVGRNRDLQRCADRLLTAGLFGALAAAVPGFIDYTTLSPPQSEGQQKATRHMLWNLTAVALYGLNYTLRRGEESRWRRWLAVPLSLAGFGIVAYSGWLGASLVHELQWSVRHLGPNATEAKSGERFSASPGSYVSVAAWNEFERDGQLKWVEVNGERIVLARSGERIFAFADRCPHAGGPLHDGVFAVGCHRIACPWHGSQFDVETGAVVAGPAETGIAVYPVRRVGDRIEVMAPGAPVRAAEAA